MALSFSPAIESTQPIAPSPSEPYSLDVLRELPPRPRTLVWALRNPAKNSQANENLSVLLENEDGYEELRIDIISNDASLPFLMDTIKAELGRDWRYVSAHFPRTEGGLN